jgi:hypothetical protein
MTIMTVSASPRASLTEYDCGISPRHIYSCEWNYATNNKTRHIIAIYEHGSLKYMRSLYSPCLPVLKDDLGR